MPTVIGDLDKGRQVAVVIHPDIEFDAAQV